MIAQPPDAIRDAIPAEAETGDVLGALQTAGEHALVADDGRWWRAPVWWVVSDRHVWLIAATEGLSWAVAEGDPREVSLELGWTRDDVRVGTYAMPLRRGTRKAAQHLHRAWEKARWGGAPWPPPPSTDAARAPA